jgi:hypothetical protein
LSEHPLARLASSAHGLRRAAYLAQLGLQAMRSGDPGDPAILDALYVT